MRVLFFVAIAVAAHGQSAPTACGTAISNNTLTAETSASASAPCVYAINDTAHRFTASPAVTITAAPAANGAYFLYINTNGEEEIQISRGAGGMFAGNSVNVLSVSSPSFPMGSYPKATGTLAAGSAAWTTVTDARPSAGAKAYLSAGNGIAAIANGVIAIDSTVPQKGASNVFTGANTFLGPLSLPNGTVAVTIVGGTVALGTGAIASGSCAPAVTVAAMGVAATDNIMADFDADPTAVAGYAPSPTGTLRIVRYPSANRVNFKVCNDTPSSITPGAITLNWRVVR